MAFAEFPDGFLISGRHDWLLFSSVVLSAALADEFEVVSANGRDDRVVVRRSEGECEHMEDSCEFCRQIFGWYRLVLAVIPHLFTSLSEGTVTAPTHTYKKTTKKTYI